MNSAVATKPFERSHIRNGPVDVLSRGRWANADLVRYTNGTGSWVIKDFTPCNALIKNTYGRYITRREFSVLSRLQGIHGVPEKPFLLDAFALCYIYIPGTTLKDARKKYISAEFFQALEKLVFEMHDRNVVHLDIRYMRNILLCEDGRPALLDFQSSLFLDRVPHPVHRYLKLVDISGVYKCWQKTNPESIDAERLAVLHYIEKKRPLWIFKGYPLGTRLSRR